MKPCTRTDYEDSMVMNFDQQRRINQRPELLAGIIGSAMDAIIAIDDAQRIVLFNCAAERMFVCPANEAMGDSIERFLPERFRAEYSANVRRFAESGVTNRTLGGLGTLWGLRTTGETFPIEASISKVESGGDRFFALIVRDSTERYRAEDAVRESEERFRLVADTAPVLIWMSGTEKLCTYFNKPWLDFTGRSMEEELGNGWAEGVHPDDFERCLQTYTQSFDRRENFRMEYRLRRHDGEYRWVLDIGVPRFNRDGSFAGYIGIGVDVTEGKFAERELAQSNERLHLTLEVGRIGGWEWDLKSQETFWFGQNYALLGVQPELESASDQTFWSRVHPEDREGLRESLQKALQDRLQSAVVEFRVVWPDQTVHWLRSEARYFYGEDGQPERMLGISSDITARKIAEEALRKSEERFRLAARAGKMFAYEWDVATDLIVRSGDIANVLGSTGEASPTRQQLLTKVHPDDLALFNASVSELTPGHPDVQISYRLFRPDGSVIWLEKTGRAFFDDQGRMLRMIGMVADITERKRAEEALRESEEKFRSVFRDAGIGMVIVSPEGRFLVANRSFCDCLGYTERELLEKTVESVTFPEDWPMFAEKLRLALTGNCGFQWLRKRCLHKTGRIVYTETSASVIRSRESDTKYLVGQVLDITERKKAEEALSSMTRKLVEAQEQERARIARELHDDINQRLALLQIELDQLRNHPSEVASRVLELEKRTDEISRDVQAVAYELHSSKLEYLGAVAAMKSWCTEFGQRQGIAIDCRDDVRGILPPEVGLCLFRVLQEALHNAAKHGAAKRVEVQLAERSAEIHLIVKDLGKGFDTETIREGRGLGLTSMQERVRLVNGTITIRSKPMGGTTIHARVPLSSENSFQRAAG
jgi:PAS domain S-box-containing protein